MKKNVYFWIFIGVAVVVCGMLLVAANNLSNEKIGENSLMDRAKVQKVEKDNQAVESEAVDLTQEDIDFEDDADDLADGLIDDAQFDEMADFEAVENEVY